MVTRAPAFFVRHWRMIYGLAITISLAYAITAIVFKVYEYADGSWFSFAIVAGRLASYGLYGVPAGTLLRLGVFPRFALEVWATLYYLTPVASLLAAYALLRREQRWRVVWPATFFLTVGVLTWGFPTEVWLTGAVAQPLLFIFQDKAANAWRLAPAIMLLVVLYLAMKRG